MSSRTVVAVGIVRAADEFFADLFERRGYNVIRIPDPDLALEQILRWKPALVIVHYPTATSGGTTLTAQIRNSAEIAATPIINVEADGRDTGSEIPPGAAGVTFTLALGCAPADEDELWHRIAAVLERAPGLDPAGSSPTNGW